MLLAWRREQEIESSASDRVKEANRRADDRIHAAEEAFKHLRRQMEDKVRGLEHELDQKRREGGEGGGAGQGGMGDAGRCAGPRALDVPHRAAAADRAKNELTELRTKLASAEQAVSQVTWAWGGARARLPCGGSRGYQIGDRIVSLQAVARADAASSSVEERLKELAEQFEQASSARAAAMEADFQRRTGEARLAVSCTWSCTWSCTCERRRLWARSPQANAVPRDLAAEERELILAEARGVLSAVESALERASDARSAAQDEVGRRVSMVERDAQSWRSKFEEAKASLREMSQARDQPLRLKDFKDAASLKDMRYEDLIQGVVSIGLRDGEGKVVVHAPAGPSSSSLLLQMARAKSTDAGA